MTIKHQPATPLPFKVAVAGDLRIIHNGNAHNRIATLRGPKAGEQAAYLKHAANAYPKLVEALRNLATGVPAHEDYYRAQALLRELGEEA